MENLNNIINNIKNIEDYIDVMEQLAEQSANYRLLDKVHYLVNEKLGIDSSFCSVYESSVGTAVYCNGEYSHHTTMEREKWIISINKIHYMIYSTEWYEW